MPDFTTNDRRSGTNIRTVASFAVMSDEDKARHLVYDHGLNDEQFVVNGATETLFPDRESVVAAFIRADHDPEYCEQLRVAADGNSFPVGMTEWHEGDHNGDGTTIGGDYADSGLRDTVGLHIHQC